MTKPNRTEDELRSDMKQNDQTERKNGFITDVNAAEAKWNIRVTTELSFTPQGLTPRITLMDTKGQEDVKETETTA